MTESHDNTTCRRATTTDPIVQAVAEAIFETRDDPYDDDEWEDLSATGRELWECYARVAVAVVRPAIAAAWDEGWSARHHYDERAGDPATPNPYDRQEDDL